ncbi:MAG: hypothetical protein ACT4P8_19390 [Betaproteobacteria bacterium]
MAANAAEKSSGPAATSGSASSAAKSDAAGNGGSASTMKRLDTDKDGSVSRDEAKKDSNVSKRFKELDKDNDGKLSSTELNAAQATGAGGSTKGSTPSRSDRTPGAKESSAQGSATEGPRKGN